MASLPANFFKFLTPQWLRKGDARVKIWENKREKSGLAIVQWGRILKKANRVFTVHPPGLNKTLLESRDLFYNEKKQVGWSSRFGYQSEGERYWHSGDDYWVPSYNPSPRSTSIRLDREVDIEVNVGVNDKVAIIIEPEEVDGKSATTNSTAPRLLLLCSGKTMLWNQTKCKERLQMYTCSSF